ncbi:MAG: HEAT repeat domain-containing protein [PVC group bacterium]
MKNLVIGLIAGLILGVLGTLLIHRPEATIGPEEKETGTISTAAGKVPAARESTTAREKSTAARPRTISGPAAPEKSVAKERGKEAEEFESLPPESGEEETASLPPAGSGEIDTLLSRWPDVYLAGNNSEIYALLNELKEEGKKDIKRLLAVFRESESLTNRLTAARTLGAINRDLQDPELEGILKKEVFPFLEKTYRDEASRDIRLACLYTMGEVRTKESLSFLEEMAGNEDSRVARAAVYSLGIDGGQKAVEKLAGYWSDPGERRLGWAGAAALGDSGDTGTMTLLRKLYDTSFQDDERIMAAYALGRMNQRLNNPDCNNLLADSVVPYLDSVISGDGDPRTRRQAVWALSESGLATADQALFRVLTSAEAKDAELKGTVVTALGSFGGREAALDCVNLMNYGEDPETRVRAGQALAMMNNRRLESAPDELIRNEVLPFLKETWMSNPSDEVKREIINGLGAAGGREEIEFLNRIAAGDGGFSRSVRRAIRRIEYREENGEDMAVNRMSRMRR